MLIKSLKTVILKVAWSVSMKRAATLVSKLSFLVMTMLDSTVERLWWLRPLYVGPIRHLEFEQFSGERTNSPVVIFTDRQEQCTHAFNST